ncbi:MAG: hypothetical protein AAGF27_10505 [Pseudomonadota bacterium]
MNGSWLYRMALWVRRPPSPARIKLVFGIVLFALVIVALERFGLWPEALTTTRMRP